MAGESTFNRNFRGKKESSKLSVSIMFVTWLLILAWIVFLIYCWHSGLVDQRKINNVIHEVDYLVNQTETSLRGGLSRMHVGFPHKVPVDPDAVHVVFSTDCSAYQDWQTLVVFHSAKVVGQKGSITRIASGCDEAKQLELTKLYKTLHPEYSVHFTPDFKKDAATNKKYDFYNKPWGLKHWLENAVPPLPDHTVVALIDPDMIFTRPLTTKIKGNDNNIIDRTATPEEIVDRVKPGHPASQTYGLGAPWTNDNHKKFNRGQICGEGSPCLLTPMNYGNHHYSVGPPYLVEKSDLIRLAQSWTTFVPRVYKGYPYLLAEMYAYSMAAAHEKLPHLQMENYMVSNVDSPGEGWPHIDTLEDVCASPTNGIYQDGRPLPTVVHFCQSYRAGDLGFQKRRVPKDIFTCESPMFVEPPAKLVDSSFIIKNSKKEDLDRKRIKRNAYMLCTIHRSINAALVHYKEKMCVGNPNTNYQKTINTNA